MLPSTLTQQSAGQTALLGCTGGGSRPPLGLNPRACVSSACGFWSVPSWPRLVLKDEERPSGEKSAHRVIDELLIGLTSPAPPTPH